MTKKEALNGRSGLAKEDLVVDGNSRGEPRFSLRPVSHLANRLTALPEVILRRGIRVVKRGAVSFLWEGREQAERYQSW